MATSRVFQGCRTLMAAAKTSTARATKTTPKNGIMKPIPVSPELGSFLGASEASRADAVKKIWEYVKLHNLQNPVNKREICCDEKLKSLFDGKDKVGFLEMNKLLSQHFVKSA